MVTPSEKLIKSSRRSRLSPTLGKTKGDRFSVIDLVVRSRFTKTQAIGYDVTNVYNLNSWKLSLITHKN
jgi:hypothetical protein